MAIRCAIYTRKSTDEGLDRAFNSLDAQREACAAYIVSQRHEGWTLLGEHYDDGGFSGGSMERPALRRLLADVEAGRIDVVVVYKVDRLTRSLTDFAKIVHVLDAARASFVSITQAFNTTTSMGRLTLNVLLSFAQFEREVISERIRDKVAASKARGMWMGGVVPLGYIAKDRKLIAVPEEAAIVRSIMERYLSCSSARDLLEALNNDGITSKRRIRRDGSNAGGTPFTRGALYHLLSNRTYVGEVIHRGKVYRGEHEAIVSPSLFDAVQQRLADRTNPRSLNYSQKIVSVLSGMVWDGEGRPMSPTHTRRHGRRYRYYASNPAINAGGTGERWRAGELEHAVRAALSGWFKDESLRQSGSYLGPEIANIGWPAIDALEAGGAGVLRQIFLDIDLRVRVHKGNAFLRFRPPEATGREAGGISREVTLSFDLLRVGQKHEARREILPEHRQASGINEPLRALVSRSFAARDQLTQLTVTEMNLLPATRIRHLERVARLSFLAPEIIRAIASGTQPAHLTARLLSRIGDLPISWDEQATFLGFSHSKPREDM